MGSVFPVQAAADAPQCPGPIRSLPVASGPLRVGPSRSGVKGRSVLCSTTLSLALLFATCFPLHQFKDVGGCGLLNSDVARRRDTLSASIHKSSSFSLVSGARIFFIRTAAHLPSWPDTLILKRCIFYPLLHF